MPNTDGKQSRLTDRGAAIILGTAAVLYVVVFSTIAAWKFNNFRYNALDLAIFTQTVAHTAAGDWFANTIHPPTYLGDHFSPALALLAIPYRAVPHPLTLLVALQVAIAAGVWPIYRLARQWFAPAAAAAMGLAYLLNPFTQNLSLFEFHFIAFAVPLLLAATVAFQRQRFGEFMAWCGAGLLIREDVALVVGAFSLLAVVQRRPRHWIWGPAAAAAVWLGAALLAIAHFAPAGSYKFTAYYAWLGQNPAEMVRTIMTRPVVVISHLLRVGNFEMIAGLLLPFAFVPAAAPAALLLALGPLAQIILGAPGGSELILKTQYSALFLPGLWLAFAAGIHRLAHGHFPKPLRVFASRPLPAIIVTVAVLYSSLMLGPLWGTLRLMSHDDGETPARRWQAALVSRVPPDAGVAASYNFLAAVAARPEVASLNYAFIGRLQLSEVPYTLPPSTRFILADLPEFLTYQLQYRRHFLYHDDYATAAGQLREHLARNGFALTAAADRYVLLERAPAAGVTPPLYAVVDALPDDLRGTVQSIGGVQFLGWRMGTPVAGPISPSAQLPLALYWQRDGAARENYYFQLVVAGAAQPTMYPLGGGFFPVPDWPAGHIVQTNSWLARPAADATDALALQVVAVNDGGLYLAPDLSTEVRTTPPLRLGPPIPLGTMGELTSN